MSEKFSEQTLLMLLPEYYKRLFPTYTFCKWLGYSEVPREYFHRRELCFTLKDDIYLRYQTFADAKEFEHDLVKKCPVKIDIGGVYNNIPKDSKNWIMGSALLVEERELVFDIDMTDYDDVRFCCTGADICAKCWPLMQFAIRIVDRALEDDFGFEHRLWIYSGRRGVHCWVADEVARKLNSQARTAIAEYLTVVRGGETTLKKVNLNFNLHPSLKRAAKVVRDGFEDYACVHQDFLGNDARIDKFLNLVPPECRVDLGDHMRRGKSSPERWRIFQDYVRKFSDNSNNTKNKKLKLSQNLVEEVMFQYCYPRLDMEVTKGLNHLLKSPFCIHPKTGKVCVPIDTEHLDEFDPFKVPNLEELAGQLERSDLITLDKKMKDYKKTNLKSAIDLFEKFVHKLEVTWKGNNLLESDLKGAEGDF